MDEEEEEEEEGDRICILLSVFFNTLCWLSFLGSFLSSRCFNRGIEEWVAFNEASRDVNASLLGMLDMGFAVILNFSCLRDSSLLFFEERIGVEMAVVVAFVKEGREGGGEKRGGKMSMSESSESKV